jgi:hypothetical protein
MIEKNKKELIIKEVIANCYSIMNIIDVSGVKSSNINVLNRYCQISKDKIKFLLSLENDTNMVKVVMQLYSICNMLKKHNHNNYNHFLIKSQIQSVKDRLFYILNKR